MSRRLGPARVLDAGSSHFKYRFVFPNSKYVGLDIDPKAIQRAEELMEGMPKKYDSVGIIGDISQVDGSLGEFDLVLSLHTLDHLSTMERSKAVLGLAQRCRQGGSLVMQGEDLQEMADVISQFFTSVTSIKCSSWLTVKMETWWGPRVGQKKYLLPQFFSFLFAIGASQVEQSLRQASNSRIWILQERLE